MMEVKRFVAMPKKTNFSVGILTVLALTGVSSAQTVSNHNSAASVDFSAGDVELQLRADRVFLTNGVKIEQDGLSMTSSRMTVAYSDTRGLDIVRLDAIGGVTITKKDLKATSDAAIYDLPNNLITLIGNVNLSQAGNRLRGGRLVVNLDAGRSTMTGESRLGDSRGRVSGTFKVKKKEGN